MVCGRHDYLWLKVPGSLCCDRDGCPLPGWCSIKGGVRGYFVLRVPGSHREDGAWMANARNAPARKQGNLECKNDACSNV
jgi:hypothetical protein